MISESNAASVTQYANLIQREITLFTIYKPKEYHWQVYELSGVYSDNTIHCHGVHSLLYSFGLVVIFYDFKMLDSVDVKAYSIFKQAICLHMMTATI